MTCCYQLRMILIRKDDSGKRNVAGGSTWHHVTHAGLQHTCWHTAPYSQVSSSRCRPHSRLQQGTFRLCVQQATGLGQYVILYLMHREVHSFACSLTATSSWSGMLASGSFFLTRLQHATHGSSWWCRLCSINILIKLFYLPDVTVPIENSVFQHASAFCAGVRNSATR
jgi:hypothetical protein